MHILLAVLLLRTFSPSEQDCGCFDVMIGEYCYNPYEGADWLVAQECQPRLFLRCDGMWVAQ